MRRPGIVPLAIGAAVVLLAGAAWFAVPRDGGRAAADPGGEAGLPACPDLAGTRLGDLGDDPAWGGCTTAAGAAVPSYRYVCTDLRRATVPRGEARLADEAPVVLIPDAGLVGTAGQEWLETSNQHASFLRTPFALLVPYRCDSVRSLPHEGVPQVFCDMEGAPLDLTTTQGCRGDEGSHEAVGRQCTYLDGDQGTRWEQWWIPGLGEDSGGEAVTLESGPDELWWVVPERHRDDRCATAPEQWAEAWR